MQAKTLSNAVWNVINGSSSALVAVVVPPFLTRQLSPDAFGAWALALQVAAYVSLFGFGIQMAVGRYVAHCEARGDRDQRDGIVSTAFWFLGAAGALAWLAVIGIALTIDRLVPQLAPELVNQTRWAIILVGFSLSVGLPASVFAAVFSGLQRSHVPAQIQGAGRILLAGCLIAAGYFRDLGLLGIVYAAISLITVAGLWHAWRTRTPAPSVALRNASTAHGRELASFCFSLTIWNFAMLLVNGFDLLIVGRYDYAATAYFAVSVTLTTLVSGLLNSLAGALVPASAGLPAGEPLRAFLYRSSRLVIGASLLVSGPLIFAGQPILELWVGADYAEKSALLLAVLVVAAFVRNAMIPYVAIAIGTGFQRKMTATPVIEGVVSVSASILLCQVWGAMGIAVAKILGSFVGVSLLLFQHALRPLITNSGRSEYIWRCVVKPASAVVPIAAVSWTAHILLPDNGLLTIAIVSVTAAASVWMMTLSSADRAFALDLIAKRVNLARGS